MNLRPRTLVFQSGFTVFTGFKFLPCFDYFEEKKLYFHYLIKAKEIRIVEVLWRFACGDVCWFYRRSWFTAFGVWGNYNDDFSTHVGLERYTQKCLCSFKKWFFQAMVLSMMIFPHISDWNVIPRRACFLSSDGSPPLIQSQCADYGKVYENQ